MIPNATIPEATLATVLNALTDRADNVTLDARSRIAARAAWAQLRGIDNAGKQIPTPVKILTAHATFDHSDGGDPHEKLRSIALQLTVEGHPAVTTDYVLLVGIVDLESEPLVRAHIAERLDQASFFGIRFEEERSPPA